MTRLIPELQLREGGGGSRGVWAVLRSLREREKGGGREGSGGVGRWDPGGRMCTGSTGGSNLGRRGVSGGIQMKGVSCGTLKGVVGPQGKGTCHWIDRWREESSQANLGKPVSIAVTAAVKFSVSAGLEKLSSLRI